MSITPDDLNSKGTVKVHRLVLWGLMLCAGLVGMALLGAWVGDRAQNQNLAIARGNDNIKQAEVDLKLSERIAVVEANQKAMEVKQADMVAMFNSINSTLNAMDRKVDVIESRVGKGMP